MFCFSKTGGLPTERQASYCLRNVYFFAEAFQLTNYSLDVCLTFYEVANVMHAKITKRVLESTTNDSSKDLFLRDTKLKGFGVRVTPKGGMGFFAEGRIRKVVFPGFSERVG